MEAVSLRNPSKNSKQLLLFLDRHHNRFNKIRQEVHSQAFSEIKSLREPLISLALAFSLTRQLQTNLALAFLVTRQRQNSQVLPFSVNRYLPLNLLLQPLNKLKETHLVNVSLSVLAFSQQNLRRQVSLPLKALLTKPLEAFSEILSLPHPTNKACFPNHR